MDLADDPPICVIGLGNLLERDDGFGPLAVQWLERHVDLPPEVELVDIGTAGLHLLTWVIGRRTVIFLDAMTAGGAPGEMRTFDRAEILGSARRAGPRISPHQPELREILTMAEVAGGAPEDVLLIGVEPDDMRDGLGLSPVMEAALEPVARRVVAELERRGVRCGWRADCAQASA
jgi:hydrogenase maturation protease